MILTYADNIILTWNNLEKIEEIKKILGEQFQLIDFGNLKYFLGTQVSWLKKERESSYHTASFFFFFFLKKIKKKEKKKTILFQTLHKLMGLNSKPVILL